jgi:hypothetical protein
LYKISGYFLSKSHWNVDWEWEITIKLTNVVQICKVLISESYGFLYTCMKISCILLCYIHIQVCTVHVRTSSALCSV